MGNTCPLDGIHDGGIDIGDGKLEERSNHQWRCISGCSAETRFDGEAVLTTKFTFPPYVAGEYAVYFGRGNNKRQLTEHIKVKDTICTGSTFFNDSTIFIQMSANIFMNDLKH